MLLSVLRIRITLGVLIDGLSKICAEKSVADLSVKVQSDQAVLFDGVIDDNFCMIGLPLAGPFVCFYVQKVVAIWKVKDRNLFAAFPD